MKILIVDNGTRYLSQLKHLLSDHTSLVVNYSQINHVNPEDFDAIVLSGGHDFPVQGNEHRLHMEIDLVRQTHKPIFGICFGFELIAHVLGATLEPMQHVERGLLDIHVVEPDKLFANISNFTVFEGHRWVVNKPVEEMRVLARSRDGIEAFKHKTRPIYAVQFHPEMCTEQSCGAKIFHNFLDTIS